MRTPVIRLHSDPCFEYEHARRTLPHAAVKTGLVLTGGGARGAYQAGVLEGLAEILGPHFQNRPFFEVITGISAGGISAAYVASKADRMIEGISSLRAVWSELQMNRVIRTDPVSLFSIGSRWLRDLMLGGMLPCRAHANHLLDTSPLRDFLTATIDFKSIAHHIGHQVLHGFGVSATSYTTGTAVTFFDGDDTIQNWSRSARLGWRTRIRLDHILASASIPILFRPVYVEGAFYGDGGIRMSTPLSPAIHLGSDRIVAISVRHARSPESTVRINQKGHTQPDISIADIAGVMLDAAFMDGLDSDAERLRRINQTIALMDEERRAEQPHQLRTLPLLVIRPSVDLGSLAADQFKRLPATLRYVTRGIGASPDRGADFLSYLAFDPSYTQPLIEVGRKDALARKDEIEAFFLDRSDTSVHPAGSSPHNHAVLPRIGTAAGVLTRSAGAL